MGTFHFIWKSTQWTIDYLLTGFAESLDCICDSFCTFRECKHFCEAPAIMSPQAHFWLLHSNLDFYSWALLAFYTYLPKTICPSKIYKNQVIFFFSSPTPLFFSQESLVFDCSFTLVIIWLLVDIVHMLLLIKNHANEHKYFTLLEV